VDVPVPADLEKLDPQLRDYLGLQINGARETGPILRVKPRWGLSMQRIFFG